MKSVLFIAMIFSCMASDAFSPSSPSRGNRTKHASSRKGFSIISIMGRINNPIKQKQILRAILTRVNTTK